MRSLPPILSQTWSFSLRYRRVVPYAMIAAYVAILSYLSMLRYWAFTDAWDFGGFIQAIYTATKGLPLVYTLNPFFYVGFPKSLSFSFLGTHFSPILFLLAPLYAIVQRPETLLFVQSFIIGVGGIPVYKLAKQFHGETVGVALLAAYLIYPGNIGMNLNDFHPETFIPTFLLFALYFFLNRRFVLGTVFSALTAMVIEEGAFLVLAVIVFMVLFQKAWRNRKDFRFYSILAGGSLVYLFVAFQARVVFGLDPTGFTQVLNGGNYQILGASYAWDVPLAVLRSPGAFLPALTFDSLTKLSWLLTLLAPVALLPLLFPEGFLVMGLPWLAVALLSNYRGYYSIYGIEQAFFIFCIFPCAIFGLKRLHFDSTDLKRTALLLLFCSLLIGTAFDFNTSIYGSSFVVSDHAKQIDSLVSLIPPSASVLTTSNIYPHLANRLEIYTVPPPDMRPGYPLIDSQILDSVNPAYILVDYKSPDGNVIKESDQILSKAVANNYSVLAYTDNVILFERGYVGEPIINVIPDTFNASNLLHYPQVSVLNNTILYSPAGSPVPAVWFGPYVFLPQGDYTIDVTVKIDVSSPTNSSLLTLDVVSDLANTVLASKGVYTSDATGSWQVFSLNFTLTHPFYDIQFRGMYPATGVSLQGITLVGSP